MTRKLCSYALASLALLCAEPLRAGTEVAAEGAQVLRLDLRSAVRSALAKNFEIRSAEYSPLIARGRLLEQRGIFDPELSLAYERVEDRTVLDRDVQRAIGSAPSSTTSRRDIYDAGIAGLTPLGTRYNFSLESTGRIRAQENGSDEFESFAGLTLVQPLLRGFGTNVVMAPIRVARAGVALSEWELRERVMDVVARTALVYNDLIFSIENLKVEERSLALANQLLRDNQKRAEIGVMSPLDITEARAAAAAREEGVILARRAVLDNENSLKQLITDEIFGLLKVRLDVAPVDMLQPPAITVEQAITLALEKRPDYRQAILELQQQRINFVVTRNNVLPQIDLTASYGLNGLNDDLASSIRNAFEENESEWRAGVVVRVPFPNRLRRGARDAEAYAIARALVDLKRLEQEIVVRVDNARGQIETARERIEATRQSRIFARERLSAEQEKLAAGSTTTFVVLELQKDLAAAEAAELRAITDFNKAVITYEREAGLTLDRNWIELD